MEFYQRYKTLVASIHPTITTTAICSFILDYLVHSFGDVLGGRHVESAVVEKRCSRDHDLSLLSMEI